ncbi:SusC/RagA family TonB-linked outer membrane protein [Niabella ginsenosidivorans]|uniref:SusC/RagA family TonB-linked outer membrane protein n=1 Tax=Niabella ginsenosidivorans TaxID=1176587 RepID=A0A1A9HXI5_9BACT|nr:TonB-dependent receptor [Niabella ginsenosidivorans]ANH80096.1 SusC/RagA family TonB-linked outer membrane protein [Niabella ginsenosidivorans]
MSKNCNRTFIFRSWLLKIVISCCCLHLSARAQAQDNPEQHRVSVRLNSASYYQVFQLIKRQTGCVFFYSNQVLNDKEKVSLNFQNAKLEEVLDYLFRDKNISYRIRGQKILLSEKKAAPAKTPEIPVKQLTRREDSTFVKGTVMDEEGKPMPGVSVVPRDRPGSGVTTDDLGIFVITVKPGELLDVSMVGMNPQEAVVPQRGNLKITLTAKSDAMKDVVITGYGKQSKITVTGAISSVNMNDMHTPVPNLSNALAGKVAGIISVQSSGEPGYDNATFTIRGIGTFNNVDRGTAAPLIIVDGVQREDVNSSYGGSFNNIDPEDVASISLLKDASATAMYGAKGANGVLIITTKRGIAGKPRISLKAETGLTGFTKRPEMLDGVSYMQLYNEARTNMGLTPFYTDEQIQKTASGLDPYLYPNVNWVDEVYGRYASLTNANVNVSGGGEAVRYFLSGSFYDQVGPYNVKKMNDFNPNLSFKRYDFRTNLDVNVTRTTLLQLNLDAMLVNARYPGISAGDLWYLSYATTPVGFPVNYPGGKWAGPVNNGGNNPLNEVQNNGYSTEFRPTVQSVFTLTQKLDAITKGLSAYGRFSFDSYGEFDNRRRHTNDLFLATGRDEQGNLIYTQTRVGQQFLDYSQSATGERVMYLEGNLNYDRYFGDHHFGGMILYNMRNRLVSTAGDAISSIPYRNQSLAGRINYGYNDKYLLELNAGYTGSENFEKGKRFGLFPSVSGGWVISKERFFDGLSNTLSLLKLRASYGVVGNDNIGGSRFPYLTQMGSGSGTGFGLNGSNAGGITENIIGVEDLTWERSYKTDIGLELGLFKKLNITADYFTDRRKDILISRQTLSSIAGYNGAQVFANLGEALNRGIDGNIEYNDQIGKVGLRVYGNVTYAVNKIVYQDEPERKYAYQRGTGRMYGEFTGYVADGLFVDQDDINSRPAQQFGVVAPGDVRYLDQNGDQVIDAGDWVYLGKSWFPKWLYGAGFSVSYHNFDLSALFQGIADVGIMANGSRILGNNMGADGVGVIPFSGIGQYPNNTLSILKDRWTADDPRQDAYYPRITIANLGDNNYLNSSRWLKDGSYLRLKQASLGYNFSTEKMKRYGFSSLYLYLSGQNLLTFSKFKLWDPELGSNGAKYPITRMYTFGIRALF